MSENHDILTLREASRYLKLSTDALGELARRRRIPAFKVGRRWRFRRSSLTRWMEKQERLAKK